ncbi:hypothetical protein H1C71_002226 [Ictidomys tridecemlineatus]|uniref:uncharacterized protein LOC120885498 n=1 Tax=Ictidomys tridecemlineatus TaxID=43179 RepID=UPI001A9E54BA|nr:uncharacterized protein LOC120885498 [Ictidomys tridecemlineatus]XP_040128889.1 uncharacterized protein LOC120885498 [Ictidomys tridecemlineatus]KAG3265810.1 hypothetical protein H1C71_002226 [Ictidomys tridecemlineatus]
MGESTPANTLWIAERMSQKSCKSPSTASSSPSLLEVKERESLSQQSQATSSKSKDSLSSLECPPRTLVASEYLPFFRTYEQLQDEEELAPQAEFCRDPGGWSTPKTPFPKDSEPPGGFCPYFRSEEESLSSLAPPHGWCRGPQSPLPNREAQGGCFCRMTVRDKCSAVSVGSHLLSGSSCSLGCCPILLVSEGCSRDSSLGITVCSSHDLGAEGLVPYYRTPEEELRTSPGPPVSQSGSLGSSGELPGPSAATL